MYPVTYYVGNWSPRVGCYKPWSAGSGSSLEVASGGYGSSFRTWELRRLRVGATCGLMTDCSFRPQEMLILMQLCHCLPPCRPWLLYVHTVCIQCMCMCICMNVFVFVHTLVRADIHEYIPTHLRTDRHADRQKDILLP